MTSKEKIGFLGILFGLFIFIALALTFIGNLFGLKTEIAFIVAALLMFPNKIAR